MMGHQENISNLSEACVMHSVIPKDSYISDSSIVEFCQFDIPVHIGTNSIISNCSVSLEECPYKIKSRQLLEIPDDVFMHTIPVDVDGVTKFVTLILDIYDNPKQESPIENLSFLGISMKKFCSLFETVLQFILSGQSYPNNGVHIARNCNISLWDACLFPVEDTASESFLKSLEIVKSVRKNCRLIDLKTLKLVSIADIIYLKSYKFMLAKRNQLFVKIQHKALDSDKHI
ncbi:hypothetical protein KUTeg_011706 [Tegillarca granosa]|uniref:GDP-fucose pyrophosphorylase domain-containing protein n=1 Tax=Tegillarca granosa TaxID=220873 RepID=A0ABQ9EZV8_TEGGR|nr:hypothetical protein KUTeg_011706 [Tegillarca granosa]